MSEELIDAARAVWIKAVFDYGGESIPGEGEERATRVIADHIADRITALIAAGDRLAGFAGHDDQCQIMTHGVWSDEVPCTCGYGAAWQAWACMFVRLHRRPESMAGD